MYLARDRFSTSGVDCCEHGNEPSSFLKRGEFLTSLWTSSFLEGSALGG
jgi:hypothetical protein